MRLPVISTVGETRRCDGCPMRRKYPKNSFVPPELPNPAHDLMRLVIAEAPGQKESEEGRPLVDTGRSGQTFNELLKIARIRRDGLTITNCLSCHPPSNFFPTDSKARSYITKEDGREAVQHCKREHLDPLLRGRKWKRVDLLGGKALRIVAEQMGGINKWRGLPLTLPSGLKAIAINHPSYLNRNRSMLPVAANYLTKNLDEAAD